MSFLLTEEEHQKAKEQRVKNRLKRLKLKKKLGILGRFISMKDYKNERNSKIIITETKGIYGRSGNRIYRLNDGGLFKKFKNSTKAKKYFNNLTT